MTVQECYELIGGNYSNVLTRIPTEKLVQKFLLKFLKDPSMEQLKTSWAKKDYKNAFAAVHTLKGVSRNLSIDSLSGPVMELTEEIRDGKEPMQQELFEKVCMAYDRVVEGIRKFEKSSL